MKKLAFKIGLFSLFSFPLFYLLSNFYDNRIPSLNLDKAHQVLKIQNSNFDNVFLGSSRVYNVIDVNLFDSIMKQNSLNLGFGGADYPELYLILNEFLNSKNKVNRIVLQVDLWGFVKVEEAYNHPFSIEKYLHLAGREIPDSLFFCHSERLKYWPRKYIPFFKYAEFNIVYPIDKLMLNRKNRTDYLANKGSILNEGNKKNFLFNRVSDSIIEYHFDYRYFKSLRKLIWLIKQHKISLTLFTSPSYPKFMNSIPLYRIAMDSIMSIAKEHKIPYYNFDKHIMCVDTVNFRDYTHLNTKGAKAFTIALADSLNN